MSDKLKSLFVEILSRQAYAALVAIPGFGWVFALPVVRPVVQYLIGRVIGWATDETAIGLSLLWIQVDLAYEVSSAEDAAAKLRAMLESPRDYSEVEQQNISEYFDDTTIDLIQLAIKRMG